MNPPSAKGTLFLVKIKFTKPTCILKFEPQLIGNGSSVCLEEAVDCKIPQATQEGLQRHSYSLEVTLGFIAIMIA